MIDDADEVVRSLEAGRARLQDIAAAADAAGEHALAAFDQAGAFEQEHSQRTWCAEIAPGLGTVVVDARGYLVELTLDRSVRTSDLSRLGERVLQAMSEAGTQRTQELRTALRQILAHVGE
jgi:hypothetical protein